MTKRMNAGNITPNSVELIPQKLKQKLISTVLALILIISTSFIGWCNEAQAKDHFQCYTGCSQALEDSKACKRGEDLDSEDYTIVNTKGSTDVIVLAIHAGSIELNTGAIAKKIAKDNSWASYTFLGHIKNPACKSLVPGSTRPNFDVLHITSENFNDPVAIEAVRAHQKAVSIHGHRQPHHPGSICVGGRNEAQRKEFITYVKSNSSSFRVYDLNPIDAPSETSGDCFEKNLKGKSRDNIVNKNSTKMGLQLELNSKMRDDLVKNDAAYKELQRVIYGAVAQAMTK